VSPSGPLAFTGLPAIAIAGAAALLLLTGTGLLRLAHGDGVAQAGRS
jgi:hypothetical protein